MLRATPAGLTTDEAKRRLRLYGPNSLARESRFAALFSFFRLFVNPLIISIVLLSVLLNFFMEFRARRAAEEIRKQVATTAAVLRDGQEQELPVAELVPGDIVKFNAIEAVKGKALIGESEVELSPADRLRSFRQDRAETLCGP